MNYYWKFHWSKNCKLKGLAVKGVCLVETLGVSWTSVLQWGTYFSSLPKHKPDLEFWAGKFKIVCWEYISVSKTDLPLPYSISEQKLHTEFSIFSSSSCIFCFVEHILLFYQIITSFFHGIIQFLKIISKKYFGQYLTLLVLCVTV